LVNDFLQFANPEEHESGEQFEVFLTLEKKAGWDVKQAVDLLLQKVWDASEEIFRDESINRYFKKLIHKKVIRVVDMPGFVGGFISQYAMMVSDVPHLPKFAGEWLYCCVRDKLIVFKDIDWAMETTPIDEDLGGFFQEEHMDLLCYYLIAMQMDKNDWRQVVQFFK